MSGMTLGELRAALRVLPPETPLTVHGTPPCNLHSYRGYYDRLAFEWGGDHPVTAADFIRALDKADGGTFTGYKGGEYYMDSSTPLYVAEYGDTGDMVVGLQVTPDGGAVIETAEEPW